MPKDASIGGTFLTRFSPRVQAKLLTLAQVFHFKAGEDMIREGDHSLYLYVVKSGRVAVEMDVPTLGRRILRTGDVGDMLCWSALVEPRLATADVRAIEDTEVLGIKGGALMDACREDYELGFELYRALTEVIASRFVATRLQLVNVFSTG
jgi:CRP-like cAMP-binding protein